MTETNRIKYKRELTPELDIEKNICPKYPFDFIMTERIKLNNS